MSDRLFNAILASVLCAATLFAGCSSSSDSGPTGTTTLAISGAWGVTIVITGTNCGGPVGETRQGSSEIRQEGTAITEILIDSGGTVLTGTLINDQYQVEGMFTDGPWRLTLRETGTVDPAGEHINGTATFDWTNTNTSETCRESAAFSAEKR